MSWAWIPFFLAMALLCFRLWSVYSLSGAGVLPDGSLRSWEQNQAKYPKNLAILYIQLLAGPVLLAICIAVNAALPERRFELRVLTLQCWVMVGLTLVGLCLLIFAVARREARAVTRVPALANSVTPVKTRLFGLLATAIPLLILLVALQQRDPTVILSLEGLAILLLLLRVRLMTRFLITQRVRLPKEHAVNLKLEEVFEREGVKPKMFILVRSPIANGYVLPSGVVGLTTGLLWLLSTDETAAIMVHELSHYRDRDITRFRVWQIVSAIVISAALVGVEYLLFPEVDSRLFMPGLLADVLIVVNLCALVVGYRTRKAEFKCDAAAKSAGCGAELASALDKLGRYMGRPRMWTRLHEAFITHPSFGTRIDRLRE